ATLSINITLILIFIIFLTILTPYINLKKNQGYVLITLLAILIILRLSINFTYPKIIIRDNPTPNLFLTIVLSGFCAVVALIVFTKLIDFSRTRSERKSRIFSQEITIIVISVLIIDNIFVILGNSLDITIQDTFSGNIFLLLIIILFLLFSLVSIPQLLKLNNSEDSESEKALHNKVSRLSIVILSMILGIIVFFVSAIIGNPFIYLSWIAGNRILGITVFGLLLGLIILLYSIPDIVQVLISKWFVVLLNLLFIFFILNLGFLHLYFSKLTGSPITPLVDLGIFYDIFMVILAGLSFLSVIVDFQIFIARIEHISSYNFQLIIGSSSIPFVLATLLFGFTYVYSVLPSLIEILFKDMILVFLIIYALIMMFFSIMNLPTAEAK
ncbi:MAG: hypothetical protein ACFFD1_08455, partial [Candidatus Thorarchaeota archaeon]